MCGAGMVKVLWLVKPPFEVLYLIPKSPLLPPGLWLAVSIIPPKNKIKVSLSVIYYSFTLKRF